jgi:hypothetical protein
MTDVMADFPHLQDKSLGDLHQRYEQLKNGPRDGPNGGLADSVLQELIAISRVLRKRSAAPLAKASRKAAAPSLDAL